MIFKKNKKKELFNDEYSDEELVLEEPELIATYSKDLEDKKILKSERNKKRKRRSNVVINVLFTIVILIVSLSAIDYVLVAKYNVGPYFMIPVKEYKDGGTKEYYSLGYKVIKYNQVQGRRDIELGTWDLEYNDEPITMDDIDLSIEFENDKLTTANKYYKKFVRVLSTVKEVNKKKNQITFEVVDEDNKYTLDIVATMADKNAKVQVFKKGDKAYVLGTIYEFKNKTKKTPNQVIIKGAYVEEYVEEEIEFDPSLIEVDEFDESDKEGIEFSEE